jgi:hypothetical protein
MEDKIFKTIEDIQEAQVSVGGRFLKQQEIKDMRVEDLLKLLIPNGVSFVIEY